MATVLVVLLLVCLLPASRDPTLRTDVVEATVSPGVTYRIERHWRLAQADAEEQSVWAYTHFQNQRDDPEFHPRTLRTGEWWITTRLRELRSKAATVWSDQFIKGDLDRFYHNLPSNWHLCDLGLSRNGKPLPLSPELAAAIWRDHSRFDAKMRAWDDWYPHALLDPTISFLDLAVDVTPVAQQIDDYVEQANKQIVLAEGAFDFGVAFNNGIESVHLHPYVLFIRAGSLIGVLGGDGRFDHIPDELK
jgi:hypothetical protein